MKAWVAWVLSLSWADLFLWSRPIYYELSSALLEPTQLVRMTKSSLLRSWTLEVLNSKLKGGKKSFFWIFISLPPYGGPPPSRRLGFNLHYSHWGRSSLERFSSPFPLSRELFPELKLYTILCGESSTLLLRKFHLRKSVSYLEQRNPWALGLDC